MDGNDGDSDQEKEIKIVSEIQEEYQNSKKVNNLIQRVGNLIDMQSIDNMIDINVGNDQMYANTHQILNQKLTEQNKISKEINEMNKMYNIETAPKMFHNNMPLNNMQMFQQQINMGMQNHNSVPMKQFAEDHHNKREQKQ